MTLSFVNSGYLKRGLLHQRKNTVAAPPFLASPAAAADTHAHAQTSGLPRDFSEAADLICVQGFAKGVHTLQRSLT